MAPDPVVECLDTVAVCRLTGVNRSTLDYWVRTGLVRPSVRPEPGRRRVRLWTVKDVISVRTVAELRASGCSLQKVRLACEELDNKWHGLRADTVLFWDGRDVLRIGRQGAVESLLKRPQQQVLRLVALPLGRWHAEASASIVYLHENRIATGVPAPTRAMAMAAAR